MWSITLIIRAVILILFLNKNSTQALKKRWQLDFFSLTCQKNSNTIQRFECDFNKLATSHYNFSVRIMFNKIVDKQFFVRYYIHFKPNFKKTMLSFVDIKLNICDAVRTDYEVPLLQTIILELRKSSNIPYQCPFKKNYLYEISNLSVTDKYMTSMSMPTINFTNGIEIYESNKLIGSFFNTGGTVSRK